MSSHWRQAGMTYLQYVNRAAHVMRTCLKEPMKSKALKNNKVHFRERAYQDGKKIDPGEFSL